MVFFFQIGNLVIYASLILFLFLLKTKLLDKISRNCGAVVVTINTFIIIALIILFDLLCMVLAIYYYFFKEVIYYNRNLNAKSFNYLLWYVHIYFLPGLYFCFTE